MVWLQVVVETVFLITYDSQAHPVLLNVIVKERQQEKELVTSPYNVSSRHVWHSTSSDISVAMSHFGMHDIVCPQTPSMAMSHPDRCDILCPETSLWQWHILTGVTFYVLRHLSGNVTSCHAWHSAPSNTCTTMSSINFSSYILL